MSQRGKLIVLSAPSGGGKTTVCERVLSEAPGLARAVTATTRAPRDGEEHGKHYYFLTAEEFKLGIQQDRFLEYAEVHGNFYGTPAEEVEKITVSGLNVVLVIDVQGARSVKAHDPSAVTVFLVPPSMEVLEKRLRGRDSDSEEVIRHRLDNAAGEMAEADSYDFVVVNDNLDQAVKDVTTVIGGGPDAERFRPGSN